MSKTRKVRPLYRAFEADAEPQGRPCFKDALFVFELGTLPDELKVCRRIIDEFKRMPESQSTFVASASSVDSAAIQIDAFKNMHCGSGFTLAIFNLNLLDNVDEFHFLMQKSVLGDPRTIFVGTMRHMASAVYTEARNKVIREDELRFGAPSCIDSYGASNRDEVFARVGKLAAAYLLDSEQRSRVGKTGTVFMQRTSPALEELYKIPTAFYGNRLKRPGK